MTRILRTVTLPLLFILASSSLAFGFPSAQNWIPSTDVTPFGKFHIDSMVYVPVKKFQDGSHQATTTDLGLRGGVLPFPKVQAEVGFDHITGNWSTPTLANEYDNHPLYFNVKLGTPEDALFKGAPALAVGGYAFGTRDKNDALDTNYNIVYGLTARTFNPIGRLSAGYFHGNSRILVDENGKKENTGLLLSWDRTISEISDKLWLAVDYQGGKSTYGATSFGGSWKFAPNVAGSVAYNIYNNTRLVKQTVMFAVGIDFP